MSSGRTQRFWTGMGAAAGVMMLLAGCAEDPSGPDEAGCASLVDRTWGDATIESATALEAEDELEVTGSEVKISDLPELCRVQGVATPTAESRIAFEVWLPSDWNGRIHMVGNGGYSSAMNFGLMADLVRGGSAAVATDTGHEGDDLSFGAENIEARNDWGHRAVHESIVAAKHIVEEHYARSAEYSYFSGCSTGGHQGLMEAQRYPDDFDGVIAGAPGNNRTNLNLGFLWQYLSNHERDGGDETILDSSDLEKINQAVVARYDDRDGVEDGVISDPSDLRFDPDLLEEEGVSLSDRQISALESMYQGPKHQGTGDVIYPGWPVGSEWLETEAGSAGWDGYWADPALPSQPSRVDFFRSWVFDDPEWDWWEFDWSADVDEVHTVMGPVVDATDPDLSAFQSSGGKLLMFTGWQDPVVSATDVLGYYDEVVGASGSLESAQDFARLFMVPGMGHCGGGPGATLFSSSTQGAEGIQDDADHNLIRALEAWVEDGTVPESLVATRPGPDSDSFTRTLCPHPQTAKYIPGGDQERAESFECVDEQG